MGYPASDPSSLRTALHAHCSGWEPLAAWFSVSAAHRHPAWLASLSLGAMLPPLLSLHIAATQTGRMSPAWLRWHSLTMKVATGLSTAGFILALWLWHKRLQAAAAIHTLYPAHAGIGIAVPVVAIIQVTCLA